ncbi:MAG: DNA-3-methyladenine glycosylase 2 family protein [Pegethrix bostrychoides GSE-TBD4-15B]|jgi:DNA-3-methyladenine glycosylase II|uniref:DNA-3-methyladenine glycosylase II n=1 Tax=Pegethrix bostrychoides GSE-TBD4-15B TaxID=2839662 RepID=A0A951PDT9_9CYAN|nr:DNA-3-methyladenine glycosylase 2 family protein [Pegethrix bostrychoides GSE-TBD4-15B]
MDYSLALASLRAADPLLANVINQVGDCRLAQDRSQGDLLATLAESILYQQLSGKAAAAIHRRFLQLYPEPPSALELLNTPDELLRTAGISRPKIAYLKDLATKLPEFPSLEALADWDDEAIITTLTQVKGIGCWTVQMLLIFRLHRWDVLPTEDLGIRSAMRRLYDLPDLPAKKAMLELAAPWQPYRTVASWYLWRSLDLELDLAAHK